LLGENDLAELLHLTDDLMLTALMEELPPVLNPSTDEV
jgi:hypothetical protein